MRRGIHKLIVVGAVVTALGLVAPAYGKIAVPEGYVPAADEPAAYSPQALRALGERGQAMSTYYLGSVAAPDWLERAALRNENGTVGQIGRQSPDVVQSPVRNLVGIDSVARTSPPTVTASSGGSFDWNEFGIATGLVVLLAGLGGAALTMRTRERVAHP